MSPVQSKEITQEPRELTYPADLDSFVTRPLRQIIKAVPKLKGLKPDENQAPLAGILQKVGANVKAFYEDFPNTASVERVSMEGSGGRHGEVWETHTQEFQYLALIRRLSSGVALNEYRTNAKGQVVDPGGFSGDVITKGFISMLLSLHPDYQADSTFRYWGRQVVNKRPTYVVAFAQRPGLAHIVEGFTMDETLIEVLLQGIAWIDAGGYQVLRLRTDVLKPKEDIGLRRQTTEIEFQTVHFMESPRVLWLPREVGVTMDWRGNHYQNRHRYSNFKLFTVGTEQKVQTPEDAHPGNQKPH